MVRELCLYGYGFRYWQSNITIGPLDKALNPNCFRDASSPCFVPKISSPCTSLGTKASDKFNPLHCTLLTHVCRTTKKYYAPIISAVLNIPKDMNATGLCQTWPHRAAHAPAPISLSTEDSFMDAALQNGTLKPSLYLTFHLTHSARAQTLFIPNLSMDVDGHSRRMRTAMICTTGQMYWNKHKHCIG